MRLYNSQRGTARDVDATELDRLKLAIADDEGIDAANLLLLQFPDGHQLKDTTAARVFVYDRTWALQPSLHRQSSEEEAQSASEASRSASETSHSANEDPQSSNDALLAPASDSHMPSGVLHSRNTQPHSANRESQSIKGGSHPTSSELQSSNDGQPANPGTQLPNKETDLLAGPANNETQSTLKQNETAPDTNVGEREQPCATEQLADPEIILDGAQLVFTHMHNNLEAVSRQLRKLSHARSQLEDDVVACAHWRQYYEALEKIPALSGELAQLIDVHEVEESYSTLNSVWSNLNRTLSKLVAVLDALKQTAKQWPQRPTISEQAYEDKLIAARTFLTTTLETASQFQSQIMTDLGKPLSILTDDLRHAEELKSKVAKVIDLPFLYGVLLIESWRRAKWLTDVGPIWRREHSRRRQWYKHYCSGSLGTLVKQLNDIGDFHIIERDSLMPSLDGSDPTDAGMFSNSPKDEGPKQEQPKKEEPKIEKVRPKKVGSQILGYTDSAANDERSSKSVPSGSDSKPDFRQDSKESSSQDVTEYIRKLDELRLTDVSRDLRGELNAMKRQFAKSMSASISSLMPQSEILPRQPSSSPVAMPRIPSNGTPVGGPPATNGYLPPKGSSSHLGTESEIGNNSTGLPEQTVALYESRLRKLETLLMQARLGSKTHELDIIRAETRAEARAEARAEVHIEQQQAKIDELESRNRELAGRLSRYTQGLETVLNSMGLQTSRVDPETGSNIYRVNRVKGLSRRVSPPLPDSRGSAESISGGTASNPEVDTPSSSLVDSARTNISMEKLLDQTFVDNHILFEAVSKRFGDVEKLARKFQVDNRRLREAQIRHERDLRQRVALHSFGPEDLILFLPTRDPRRQPNPWAAFNAAAPHYFLNPKHAEQLKNREYLIARASSIEKHVVEVNSDSNDNPFDLPVGVEWYLISIYGEWGV